MKIFKSADELSVREVKSVLKTLGHRRNQSNHAHHTNQPEMTRLIRGLLFRVVSCDARGYIFLVSPNLRWFDLNPDFAFSPAKLDAGFDGERQAAPRLDITHCAVRGRDDPLVIREIL